MTASPRIPEVLFLTNSIAWFGAHTGFQRLPLLLDASEIRARVIEPPRGVLSRFAGKLFSTLRGHGELPQDQAFARAQAELIMRLNRHLWTHLVYGETHMDYWKDAPASVLHRTIVSLHQPPSNWSDWSAKRLKYYRHAHVLWQRHIDWFQSFSPDTEIVFIHHGVDTDFFSPGLEPPVAPPYRLLYAGVHLRNLAMLKRIVQKLGQTRQDIQFDLLVPEERRNEPGLAELHGSSQVKWHANLSDDQLRELYRAAHLMVLPMNDSGANTAVIEAMACGLPIVTTDVGGIRDYGGGSIYPVVANDDDDAMIGLIEDYLAKPALRQIASDNCRAFAETVLAWPLILQKHVAHYRRLMS